MSESDYSVIKWAHWWDNLPFPSPVSTQSRQSHWARGQTYYSQGILLQITARRHAHATGVVVESQDGPELFGGVSCRETYGDAVHRLGHNPETPKRCPRSSQCLKKSLGNRLTQLKLRRVATLLNRPGLKIQRCYVGTGVYTAQLPSPSMVITLGAYQYIWSSSNVSLYAGTALARMGKDPYRVVNQAVHCLHVH